MSQLDMFQPPAVEETAPAAAAPATVPALTLSRAELVAAVERVAAQPHGTAYRRASVELCGRIIPADAAHAVGRFLPGGPTGYRADTWDAELRATRSEAVADWVAAKVAHDAANDPEKITGNGPCAACGAALVLTEARGWEHTTPEAAAACPIIAEHLPADVEPAADVVEDTPREYSALELARGYDLAGKVIPGGALDTAKTAEPARVTVEHSGDGTTATFERDDLEAREAVKAAGFRWSRNLGAWFLPRTWHINTRAQRVRQLVAALPAGAVAVEDAGHAVTTTAAEREELRRERAEHRAERLDARADRLEAESDRREQAAQALSGAIPFGQPILIGHHSERRHRRDLEKIQNHTHKAWDAAREAREAEQRAETARRTAAGPTPLARLRRIERNETEARKIARRLQESDDLEALSPAAQKLAADRYGLRPISAEYREQLTAAAAQLADEIAHDRAAVEASGHRQIGPDTVAKGDRVLFRGTWYEVRRVNAKTVTIPSMVGGSWTDTVKWHEITGHKTAAELADAKAAKAAEAAGTE